MKSKSLSIKKIFLKIDTKKVLKIIATLLILALLASEGLKEYRKLKESGVLRETTKKDNEYDLGLGDVGSKHYEIAIPEDWQKYDHKSFSFYFPQSFHDNNNEFTSENQVRLAKNDQIPTDFGGSTESNLRITGHEGNMLPDASFYKQVFLNDWKRDGGVSTISHLDRFSLNNRSVYHLAFRVDFKNYNPLQPTPFSQHTLYIQVGDRYYTLSALNIDLTKEDEFTEELLGIAASIENQGDLVTPEHQLPLGLRKPSSVEEQLQLGKDLLDFTEATITFGDHDGEITLIAFVSTLSTENYPTIIGLSEYVNRFENVALRFEIIPIVESNLNQYSYNDALLYCSLKEANLNELSGEISNPTDIRVIDPEAVTSCLSNSNLVSEIYEKSVKATDFGIIDTPVVTVLYKGAWQGDYYGWDEIRELIDALGQINAEHVKSN